MTLHLSQNIKLIRGLAGKTQPEFAKIIGENVSNLKTYERTGTLPKLHIRMRIADIAGVSVDDLLKKGLTEKDIKLKKDENDGNGLLATQDAPVDHSKPQNGQNSGTHPTLTDIGELVRIIQNATFPRITIEQIADRIKFSRPHLTTLLKSGKSKKALTRLKLAFAKEIAAAPELTTTTNKPVFDVKPLNLSDKDTTIKILSEVTKSQQDFIEKQGNRITEMSSTLINLVSKVIEKL